MAQKILLVNPIKRKRRRTAKQKAATKKLIAFNKKRSKPARKRATPTKRKVNPMAARRRKARTAKQRAATRKLIAFNRRGARKAPAKRRRRRNPIVASSAPRRRAAYRATRTMAPVRRRRRNQIRRMGPQGWMNDIIMPAVTAATGALALDAAWGYLPLPVDIKQGPMKHLAKAAGALALYWGASMVVRPKTAEAMAVGALTVVAHQAAKEMIMQFMPEVGMRMAMYDDVSMGYYNAGLPVGGYARQNGALPAHGMGLYVPNGGGAGMAEYDEMGVYVQ